MARRGGVSKQLCVDEGMGQFFQHADDVVQLHLYGPLIHFNNTIVPVPPFHLLIQKVTIASEYSDRIIDDGLCRFRDMVFDN